LGKEIANFAKKGLPLEHVNEDMLNKGKAADQD